MIDQEMLDRLGQIWKRFRRPGFGSDPFSLMRDARMFTEELPVYYGKLMRAGAMAAQATGDRTPKHVRDDIRQCRRVMSGMLWAMRRMGFNDSEQIAMCKAGIGLCHSGLGHYQRASEMLAKSLKLMRQHTPFEHEMYLASEYAWANSEMVLGRGSGALPWVEEAISRARNGNWKSEYVSRLEALARALRYRSGEEGRSRRDAEEAVTDCLRRYGRESRETVEAICNLALLVELPEGNVSKATQLLAECLYLLEVNRGVFWSESARIPVEILAAEIERRAGHGNQEISHLKAAESAGCRLWGDRDPALTRLRLQLAARLEDAGFKSDALEYLRLISKDPTDLNSLHAADRAQYLTTYAGCQQSSSMAGFDSLYGDFLASIEEEGKLTHKWAGEDLQVSSIQKIWSMIGLYITTLLTRPARLTAREIASAYGHVVEFKGMVAESHCISRERRLAVLYPECRADLERLVDIRRKLQGTGDDAMVMEELRNERWRLENSLESRIPELRKPVPSVAELAADFSDLDENSVLLDFVHVSAPESHSSIAGFAVFILQAGKPEQLRCLGLGDSNVVLADICKYRESLLAEVDPTKCDAPPPDCEFLWRRVWAPIEDALQELRQSNPGCSFRRLFVSLDHALALLPLQVLRNPAWPTGRYLIDEYEISYLTTPRDIQNIPNLFARPGTRPLVVGLCDFGAETQAMAAKANSAKKPVFGKLRDAELQAARVSKNVDAEVWIGPAEVTKERFIERLGHVECTARNPAYRSPSIIHIASHGFSLSKGDGGHPADLPEDRRGAIREALLRSGLALSGASHSAAALLSSEPLEGPLPGVVTAYEVSGLDLRETGMVVLSACDTGLGTISSGEGVFGLQRAFFIAGANSLIMALWPVKEEATRMLMESFYSHLKKGLSRSAGLRAAQQQVRLRLPWAASWGGFICQGNPLPISELIVQGSSQDYRS